MLLNITALTKTYTISGKLIIALNTVDLTFSENSFTCIVGKSGCGKTTITRLVNGLIPRFYDGELTGQVVIDGKDIADLTMY